MSDISELLERFRRGPEVLAVVLTGVFGEEEDFAAGNGGWSIRQIMAHVADSELVGGHRIRLVIAEDNPTLTAFDQDAWTRRLGYQTRKPKDSLESFRRLRRDNFELLRGVAEEDFARSGNHAENGTMTLRGLVEGYARHAESHAAQMQHIRDEYRHSKSRK